MTGEGRLDAALAGAVWSNQTKAVALGETFRVDVVRGDLQVDTTEWAVVAGGAGLTPAENSRSQENLANATITDLRIAAGGRILILPLNEAAQAAADPVALGMAASTLGKRTFESNGNQKRSDLHVDATSAVTINSAVGGLTVSGSFRVVVWAANFTIHQGGSEKVVATGDTYGAPPGVPGPYTVREAFVTVQSGSATIPLGSSFEVHLASSNLALESGTASLHDPRGSLPIEGSPVPVTSRELVLEAPFAADMDGRVDHVGVAFTQAPQGVVLDGRAVRPAAADHPWWIAVALVGLAGVPLAGRAWSQRHLRRQLRDLDGMVRAKSTAALALARRIRRRRPGQEEALVAETVGLLQGGQYIQAQRVLDEPVWPASLRPLRTYMLAHAFAGQGRHAESRISLESALMDAPELRSEAASNPLLAPLLGSSSRPGGRHAVPGAS